MKSVFRTIAFLSASVMCLSGLGACGSASSSGDKGQIYYLNTKPEVESAFKKLGDEYSKKTGVKFTIQTLTNGTYDSQLTSELAKKDAPTMFNMSGYSTYAKIKSHLEPMQNTAIYKKLTPDGKAASVTADGKAYTVPFVQEYNGIIYHKDILNKYCKKDYAVIKSVNDIKNFATLKKVVESIQAHKSDLGLDGAWASPGLDQSDTYRFCDHMARIPVSAELRDKNTTFTPKITGKYLSQFKDMMDLQIKNNPKPASQLSSATLEDDDSQFGLNKVVFYNNGTWTYSLLKDLKGNTDDIGLLPFWMGIPGEQDYSVVGILETQWGVNSKAPSQDKKATIDFMNWLATNKDAQKTMTQDMAFSVPFTTVKMQPKNPITVAAAAYKKQGKKYIFNVNVPSQQYKDNINNALVEYEQGTGSWDKVESAFINGWQTEWANNKKVIGSLPEARPMP